MRVPAYQTNTPFSKEEQDEIVKLLPDANSIEEISYRFNFSTKGKHYEINFQRIPVINLDEPEDKQCFNWFYFEWTEVDENGAALPGEKTLRLFSGSSSPRSETRKKKRALLMPGNTRVQLNTDLSVNEYDALPRTLFQREILYIFRGITYGCTSPEGIACSFVYDETPFFEIPVEALDVFVE